MKTLISVLTFYKNFLIDRESLEVKLPLLKADLEQLAEYEGTYDYYLAGKLIAKLEKRLKLLILNEHHFFIRSITSKKLDKLFNNRYA